MRQVFLLWLLFHRSGNECIKLAHGHRRRRWSWSQRSSPKSKPLAMKVLSPLERLISWLGKTLVPGAGYVVAAMFVPCVCILQTLAGWSGVSLWNTGFSILYTLDGLAQKHELSQYDSYLENVRKRLNLGMRTLMSWTWGRRSIMVTSCEWTERAGQPRRNTERCLDAMRESFVLEGHLTMLVPMKPGCSWHFILVFWWGSTLYWTSLSPRVSHWASAPLFLGNRRILK